MQRILDAVLKYSPSKTGRLTAYATLVESHCSRDLIKEAFETSFLALAELGDKMPKSPGKGTVILELMRCQRFMKKYPIERLKQLSELKEPTRVQMMKILVQLTT